MTTTETPLPDDLRCAICGAMEKPGAKPMFEKNNGSVTCVSCGHTWTPPPEPEPPDEGQPF